MGEALPPFEKKNVGRKIHFIRNLTLGSVANTGPKLRPRKPNPGPSAIRSHRKRSGCLPVHSSHHPASSRTFYFLPPKPKPPRTSVTPQDLNLLAPPKATNEFERERESAPEMSADELRLDLEELRRLEGLATRPRVLSLLSSEIRTVDAKVCPLFFPFFLTPRPRAFRRSIPSSAPAGFRSLSCADVPLVTDSWPRGLRLRLCRRRWRSRRRPLPV